MSETLNESEYDDLLDETEHRWRGRLIVLAVLAALVAGGVYALWALVLSGGDTVTAEVQTATVERGSISQTVSTTGTVAAQSTTELSFDQSGRVSAVSVTLGQEVKAGDVLAEIESDELQDSVTQAEVNLTTAQTKLSQLLKGSDASELASADQSLIQAQASYDQAVRSLEDLSDGPSDSERLSAEQAVISAQAQLDQANLELADLTTDPTDSERLSAEQGVLSAQAQLDQANRELSELTSGASGSELLSAQQAVTAAQAQLDQAKAKRAELDSSSADLIAAAEAAVRKAQNTLDSAERAAENASNSLTAAEASLNSAETAYCAAYGATDDLDFCDAREAPVSSSDEDTLSDVTADPSAEPAHAAQAASMLAANNSYRNALATEEAADAAVDLAEADLAAAQSDLAKAQSGPSSADIASADASVTAAQQALESANVKLAELTAGATENELATAQQNVETATAALATANAKLAELDEGPTQSESAKARDSVETAAAGLDVAQAKLAELYEGPTESDLEAARDNVETAGAGLTVAEAKHDDTYAGSDAEDIALQRDQVKLAQLSVQRAQENLEEAKLVAPFDGTVAELNVEVGEVVGGTAGEAAIVLNTPNAVRLELTITESDLPNVKAGQSGVATFDALESAAFPIEIESVGLNPTSTQGVVTYQVRASINTALAAVAGGRLPTASREAMLGPAAEVLGMTQEELQSALASGQSITEIAESRGISAEDLQAAIAQARGAAAADAGAASQADAEDTPQAGTPAAGDSPPPGTPVAGVTPPAGVTGTTGEASTAATPLPGMNATVTIIVDQAQDVIVVPDSAVQSEGPASVVEVQNEDGTTEKVVVETGLSDGTNTEITSGLEEGQTVIVPSRSATSTTTSTQLQQGGFPVPDGAGGGPSFQIGGGP